MTFRVCGAAYRVRTGGKAGLMAPTRIRPLSAKFAGSAHTGGNLEPVKPERILALSLVAGLGLLPTFSATITITVASIVSPRLSAGDTILSAKRLRL